MRYWLNDKIEQRADSYASYSIDSAEKFGIKIEEYPRQCILWTVNEPEQFEKWIEDCRKEYDF